MQELGLGYSLNDSDSEEESKKTSGESSQEEQREAQEFAEAEGATVSAEEGGGGGGKVEKVKVRDNMSLEYKLLDDLHIADQNNPIHQQYSELEMLAKAGKSNTVAARPRPKATIAS